MVIWRYHTVDASKILQFLYWLYNLYYTECWRGHRDVTKQYFKDANTLSGLVFVNIAVFVKYAFLTISV